MRNPVLLAFIVVMAVASCSKIGAGITDADVLHYIAASKNLKVAGPLIAAQAKKGAALSGQPLVEDAVRRAGFKSYAEFVVVNGKIAWAFGNGQAAGAMASTAHDVSEGEKTLQQNIADPNVPEAAKVEMRKALVQMQADYSKNKGYAHVAMNVSDALTNKDDVAVVMKHKAELEAALR